jgi:hypothetical protein
MFRAFYWLVLPSLSTSYVYSWYIADESPLFYSVLNITSATGWDIRLGEWTARESEILEQLNVSLAVTKLEQLRHNLLDNLLMELV